MNRCINYEFHHSRSKCRCCGKTTGKINWKSYSYIKNSSSPASSGIDPADSKLLFISSAGGYLPAIDKPFDACNILGDYSIRKIPIQADFNATSGYSVIKNLPATFIPSPHNSDHAAAYEAKNTNIQIHVASQSDPHNVTPTQIE